jgi:hypothetical protein
MRHIQFLGQAGQRKKMANFGSPSLFRCDLHDAEAFELI